MTDFMPDLMFDETSFMSRGACVSHDPKYFDTSTRDGVTTMTGSVMIDGRRIPRRNAISYARMICMSCPVQAACLDYITRHPSETSIWAGLLPEERNDAA